MRAKRCIPRAVWLAVLLLVIAHTGTTLAGADLRPGRPVDDGADLVVRRLAPGVWLHLTFDPDADGVHAPVNGLLIAGEESSILVDTGWTPEQTERLLLWADERIKKPVRHLIVTHAHVDRIGGLGAFGGRQVEVYAHAAATESLRARGLENELHAIEFEKLLELDGTRMFLFYPGAGHAPDNLLVWLPEQKVLFGGCFVRAAESRSLGNVESADLDAWPVGLRRTIERFRDVESVVPGHGRPGGPELLSHTMELLER